jgi:hypothetical protein
LKFIKILLTLVYAALVITAAAYSVYHPSYNWDVLPYTASVYSLESNDTAAIHKNTFDALKNKVDAKTYIQLTTGSEYREAMATCAKCFMEQLPFYRIKALYVLMVYVLYKTGVNVVSATVLVSAISYILINLICFIALKHFTKNYIIIILTSIIVALFPFMLNSAGDSAPNMLSALIVLSAFYLLIAKRKLYLFMILMLISVIARQDNIILLALFLIAFYWIKQEEIKTSKFAFLLAFITAIAIFWSVNLWAGNYNWKILFEHSFSERIISPAEHTPAFSPAIYLKAFLRWSIMLKFSLISFQLLIILITLYRLNNGASGKIKLNFDMIIIFIVSSSIIIHYLIYPVMEDNYFIAQYLVIDIIFVKTMTEGLPNMTPVIPLQT